MTVESLGMAYRLYGTISVNAFFSISFSYGGVLCASALIVRHKPDGGLQRAEVENKNGPRGVRHSAQTSAAYLYSVGPMGPEP
jgi:hypothetical protein